jgi:hypothetical protein
MGMTLCENPAAIDCRSVALKILAGMQVWQARMVSEA